MSPSATGISLVSLLTTLLAPVAGSEATVRLVVVISIDQFPRDYLTRFSRHFGEGGFRFLTENGAVFTNAEYEHAATMTGPGHAVISTGSYPNENGIVSNGWYDTRTHASVYCVEDSSVELLGAKGEGVSPRLLLLSTIGDELTLSSGSASRVVSVSQKDRSAILMGGGNAHAAYWLEESLFVTSTFYMKKLPVWVEAFNQSGIAMSFFGKTWDRILPEAEYSDLDRDDAPYEGDRYGVGRTFPHRITGDDTTKITASYFDALWNSPFLNDLMLAFVKQAIVADSLGIRGSTDMLFIGLSANDAVGHTFGPQSHEVLDMTVRTDRLLADLLQFIDKKIGAGNCLFVLTSDHGIPPIPEYLLQRDPETKAGRVGSKDIVALCDRILAPPHEGSFVERVVDGNIYLDRNKITESGRTHQEVMALLVEGLKKSEVIGGVITGQDVVGGSYSTGVEARLAASFLAGRSGDIVFALKPYFIAYSGTSGTDHGQPYDYDTRVPVIFAGKGVRPGKYDSKASPADIAPTLARLLGIAFPGERAGRVLEEAIDE